MEVNGFKATDKMSYIDKKLTYSSFLPVISEIPSFDKSYKNNDTVMSYKTGTTTAINFPSDMNVDEFSNASNNIRLPTSEINNRHKIK